MLAGLLSLFLGSRLGIAALSGLIMLIAVPLAFGAGILKGTWQTEARMITQLEKVSLENEIANLKEEKRIAEEARKQAEADEAAAQEREVQLTGEVNEYKLKLEKAGRKCELTPDDLCDIYGVRSKQCNRKNKKTGDRSTRYAKVLLAQVFAAVEWRCTSRPQAMCRHE